jgi:hypothetical protein
LRAPDFFADRLPDFLRDLLALEVAIPVSPDW